MNPTFKRTSLLFVLTSFLLSSNIHAQKIKNFEFKGFNSIDIKGSYTGEIIQGDEFKVIIEFEDPLEDNIEVKLDGNTLKISLKGSLAGNNSRPKVTIQLPELKELELSGACDITLIKISVENLEVEVSGASSLKGDLDINNIRIDASGASSLGFSGRTNKIEIYLSGASSFKGKGLLITDEMLLDCSGASTARCQVDGDMFIKMSGASSLTYSGEGDILKQELSGASQIKKL